MLLKQWICVALMFVLYPIAAYSQTSLYRLSTADTSLGLALRRQDIGIIEPKDTTTLGANLDYGIELSSTVTALGGLQFSFERSDIAFRVGLNFY